VKRNPAFLTIHKIPVKTTLPLSRRRSTGTPIDLQATDLLFNPTSWSAPDRSKLTGDTTVKRRRSPSASFGFTLIEVLIAMFILSGALIVLANSWSGSLLAVRKSRHINNVALLLKRKITEYEIKYNNNPGEAPEEEGGDFGSDYKNYRWKMKTKKIEMPDMAAGLASRKQGVTEIELILLQQLKDFIERSVKEMKISVFLKMGEKEIEYSVTSYLVDYNQPILGGN